MYERCKRVYQRGGIRGEYQRGVPEGSIRGLCVGVSPLNPSEPNANTSK